MELQDLGSEQKALDTTIGSRHIESGRREMKKMKVHQLYNVLMKLAEHSDPLADNRDVQILVEDEYYEIVNLVVSSDEENCLVVVAEV